MEKILGVTESIKETMLRTDAHEADILEQDEQRDAARQRYQRLYWESVPEDGRVGLLLYVLTCSVINLVASRNPSFQHLSSMLS